MVNDLLVYVKPGKKEEISKRHPNIDADSFIENEDVEDIVVCKSENGEDRCESGEQWIDAFTRKPLQEEREQE
jgi:hypothetical protein